MRYQIYVISSNNYALVVPAISAENALDISQALSCPGGGTIEYTTPFLTNPKDVQFLCDAEFKDVTCHDGWVDAHIDDVIDAVEEIYSDVAIEKNEPSNSSNYAAELEAFAQYIGHNLTERRGLHRLAQLMLGANKFRASRGLGSRQLSGFFMLDSTRKAIVAECAQRNKRLGEVKTRYAPHSAKPSIWVSVHLFNIFLQWASGICSITLKDIKDYVALEESRVNEAKEEKIANRNAKEHATKEAKKLREEKRVEKALAAEAKEEEKCRKIEEKRREASERMSVQERKIIAARTGR